MDEVIDTTRAYFFTNALKGPQFVLAVSNAASNDSAPTLSMAAFNQNEPNGQWFLTRVRGDQPGIFFRIHSASMGLNQSIDVVNQGGAVTSTRLKMAESGNSSGQAWRFNRWSEKESDGYRLSNKMSGPDVHLDVTSDTLEAQLFGGDFPGQHWTLVPVGSIATFRQEDAGRRPDQQNGRLLSSAGVAGLTTMAVLGLAVLVLWAILLWMQSRSRSKRNRAAFESNMAAIKRMESAQSFYRGQGDGQHLV